ncbi:MKK1 [Symbiodinium sp. CCMP2592]|nr:MKK1 [Symbiodinium sp. CCMP2592]
MKRPAKRQATQLQRAVAAGVVKKAVKPFALFCQQRRLSPRKAASAWRDLGDNERKEFLAASRLGFSNQRQAAEKAGVRLRNSQRTDPPVAPEPLLSDRAPDDITFGDYIVCGSQAGVGQGGYGGIMKVRHRVSHRIYAAKVSNTNFHLSEEVALLKQLAHETFLPLLAESVVTEDEFVPGQISFMIMPYVAAGSVLHYLHNVGAFDAEKQLALTHQVLAGLAHLHRRTEHIHGDVKPQNILYDPLTNSCFIIDFGMTYRLPLAEDFVEDGAGVYTYAYRAPEVAKGMSEKILKKFLTVKADAWALAMTVHQAATKKALFHMSPWKAAESLLELFDACNPGPPDKKARSVLSLSNASREVAEEVRLMWLAMAEPVLQKRRSCQQLAEEHGLR